MGINHNIEIYVIWIDANAFGKEISECKAELEKFDQFRVERFIEVEKGINCLKEEEKNFKKTIVITSGRLYPEFYNALKNCINNLYVIPKIIIYTSNAKNYREANKNHENPCPLDDPIYNIGGVVDNKNDLKKFIEISINNFSGNYYETIKNEEFKFQFISDKNELILPMYLSDNIKVANQDTINNFVEYLTKEFKNITPISYLFSQLPNIGNITNNLLIKFWLRAYSTHLITLKNPEDKINSTLNEKNLDNYLPIIQLLYKAVNSGSLNSEGNNKLFKGIFIPKYIFKEIFKNYNMKENGQIPKVIIYGNTFFSFYKDINTVKKFRNYNGSRFGRFDVYLNLILEGTTNFRFVKNNTIITKEVSYFDAKYDDEILFFPFSCFEIVNIEKNDDNEYTLILNYLDKYTSLFNNSESRSLKKIIKNDYSELVMSSGLIDTSSNDLPKWCTRLFVVKRINDENLFNSVNQICQDIINKNNFNFENDLRVKIQKDLEEKYNGDWWISIKNEKINNFGTINEDSVMIFKCSLNSGIIYIHIAKLIDED